MARVSKQSIEKLNEFIDSLPAEAKGKCALCTQTLTHLAKTAEVKAGVGTATATRHIAEWINEGAAPGDRVTGERLQDRVRTSEQGRRPSKKEKMAQCQNKPQPEISEDAGKDGVKRIRRTGPYDTQSKDMVMSDGFRDAYDYFLKQVVNAKAEGWEKTSKEAICRCMETINLYLGD